MAFMYYMSERYQAKWSEEERQRVNARRRERRRLVRLAGRG